MQVILLYTPTHECGRVYYTRYYSLYNYYFLLLLYQYFPTLSAWENMLFIIASKDKGEGSATKQNHPQDFEIFKISRFQVRFQDFM